MHTLSGPSTTKINKTRAMFLLDYCNTESVLSIKTKGQCQWFYAIENESCGSEPDQGRRSGQACIVGPVTLVMGHHQCWTEKKVLDVVAA